MLIVFDSQLTNSQRSLRGYASEAGPKSGSNLPIYATVGVAALAGGYYYTTRQTPTIRTEGPPEKAFKGGDQGFISLKLENIETVSPNTKKFRFALPEPDQIPGLPIASAVVTKYKGPEDAKPTIRPYTPVSDEGEKGHVDFLIKQYPNGPMSEHIHSMSPGQQLEIKGPIPKYPMEENKHNHIVMIAGGTGITPMYQVARHVFGNPNDKTKVTLVFGNVTEEDILLRKEFNELENTYPQRFRAFYTLDKPPEDWQYGKGFVTKDLLKTVMPEPKEENIKIFVCGKSLINIPWTAPIEC